jgi:serine protease Do
MHRPKYDVVRALRVVVQRFVMASAVFALIGTAAFAGVEERKSPIVRAAAGARPSVVSIQGRKTVRNEGTQGSQDQFRAVNGMGTGVIIDERGYILTNFHVVDGVSRIQVSLDDKSMTIGRLIAHDSKTDLAIIKIDTDRDLSVIRIGTSSDLMEGETVIALGNAFGYKQSLTSGIISSLHRIVEVSDNQTYYDLIQTDAPINPGNSGGPLLNIDGEMIGINVAVRVGAQGIAFAIPVNAAMEVAAELIQAEIKNGQLVDFECETIFENNVPRLVCRKVANREIGLQPGDVIESIDGRQVSRSLDLKRMIVGRNLQEPLKLGLRRGEESLEAEVGFGRGVGTAGVKIERNEEIWRNLGVVATAVSESELKKLTDHPFHGGMKVIEVRPNSPMDSQNVRAGDILIGIHEWETTSESDLLYIGSHPSLANGVKFYFVRGTEVIDGRVRVAMKSN